MIDLNSGSGFVYGGQARGGATSQRINALIDSALVAQNRQQRPRNYLGGSRIGEPCARKLIYEFTNTPVDAGKGFNGQTLRIFDAGHQFETLSIRWLRAAGFDLRDKGRNGRQFGFSIADGRIRGHIDGVIVSGPDVGIVWPALFEHKTLNAKSWTDLVKRGVELSHPIYYAQLQIYMAYRIWARRYSRRSTRTARRSITRSSAAMHAPLRHSPIKPSTSSAQRNQVSCRPASPLVRSSISAAGARTQSVAGRAGHDFHAFAAAGSRHSRDRGLVPESASQATSVPAVWLIFYSADSQVIERTRESALETRLGTTFPVIG
jgi:hypothetical protein